MLLTTKRLALLFAMVGAVAACKTSPPAPPPPAPLPPPAVVEPAPPAEPEVPTGPATPAAQAQAQKSAQLARDLLEAGNEEQAKAELQRALVTDANNKLAHNLLRQLSVDPVATLGRESFPYVVKPGESLSRIAQRFMGDPFAFYILARYNDIKVPRQLAGGQTIRVPGKAPPPEPPPVAATAPRPPAAPAPAVVAAPSPPMPAPAPAQVAVVAPPAPPGSPADIFKTAEGHERNGDLPRAYDEYRRAGDHPGAAAKAETLRRQLMARATVDARSAFAKQDLDGAIRNWERVLELDPPNETAKLEIKKAQTLKDRLKTVK